VLGSATTQRFLGKRWDPTRSRRIATQFDGVSIGVGDVHAGRVALCPVEAVGAGRAGEGGGHFVEVDLIDDEAQVIHVHAIGPLLEEIDDRGRRDPHGREGDLAAAPLVEAVGFEAERVAVERQGALDVGATDHHMVETGDAELDRHGSQSTAGSAGGRLVCFPLEKGRHLSQNERMSTTTSYLLAGLDPSVADALRAGGGIRYVADEHPGFPCRQCLRDAEIGEEVILVSHDPFDDSSSSPYRSASPIFLHRWPCAPPDVAELPEQLTGRRLSVRAFDTSEMMLDAALIDGRELATTIERLLENTAVDHLHVHNEPRGCFAARVVRPTASLG